VCGELIGQAADLAAAHRVGLSCEGERPRSWHSNAAGSEMTVDDAVDLVSALRRLVHALRETGDNPLCDAEQIKEPCDIDFVEP
jgi:hypothetical protein